MRSAFAAVFVLLLAAASHAQTADAAQVLALETAWNHAIEAKDTKAIDLILADTMVALGSDGSFLNKKDYLAGIKGPDFQPSQAVNEKNRVEMYGDTAVAIGIFRIKEVERGKTRVHRERTIDTWVKIKGQWKCVAAVAMTMPAGQSQ